MKTIILLLIPLMITAQGSFKNDNGSIIWQRIYQTHLTQSEVANAFERSGSIEDGYVKGNLSNKYDDGSRVATIKGYMVTSDFKGKVNIDLKDGKYRVTVSNIILEDTRSLIQAYKGNKTPLEMYAINRNGFKSAFTNNDYLVWEYNLNKIFDPMSLNTSNDDW